MKLSDPIKKFLKHYELGLIAAIIVVVIIFTIVLITGTYEFTKPVIITDYYGTLHQFDNLKANPFSAYFEIQILNKSRFSDGKPYLTAYSIGGHIFTPYSPLSEEHSSKFEIGHTYVIERPIWDNDIIPLMEVNESILPTDHELALRCMKNGLY